MNDGVYTRLEGGARVAARRLRAFGEGASLEDVYGPTQHDPVKFLRADARISSRPLMLNVESEGAAPAGLREPVGRNPSYFGHLAEWPLLSRHLPSFPFVMPEDAAAGGHFTNLPLPSRQEAEAAGATISVRAERARRAFIIRCISLASHSDIQRAERADEGCESGQKGGRRQDH